MKTFDYISREYVPSIDLNTLGKTYDTLEQGHKEAVKAASDLEVTMANLDLNEAESEWRQQKINEIKETVAENTIYGNSYAALDDIITKAGNIMSDQGMIGRLQAQKDYKSFRTKIENDNTLPQDYKNYYLENNPYHYKDKYDKNGNIIGGTKWTPNSSPTVIVPLSKLITQGISIAAKESGGGNVTRWIDKYGNITQDPSQAFDGEVFNTTTNQWERLSREKIWQGIKSMINSTPGAIESIKQDYDVARWKHEKAVKANKNKPFESDITDSNGIYLSEEQYLYKRVDPAVQAASYYNSINKTTYGNGLATYQAARTKSEEAVAIERLRITKASMSGRNTPVEINVNQGAEFMSTKNVAKNNIKSLYKQITGKNLFIPDNITIKNMEQLLDKYDVSVADRQQIRANVKAYNEAKVNLSAFTSNMSDKDKANFMFAARMKSGGELISSTNGGSKYDDMLINSTNKLYGKNGQTLVITLKKEMLQNINDIINSGKYDGYSKLGIKQDDNKIIIPKSSMYVIPMIASIIDKAESRVNSGFFNTLIQAGSFNTGTMNIDVLDQNGKSVYGNNKFVQSGSYYNTMKTTDDIQQASNSSAIRQIAKIYNDGIEENDKLYKKYQINPTTITVSSLNLDGNNFTEATLLAQYNKGLITKEQYETNKKYFNESFENIVKSHDFSQNQMYMSEGGGTRKLVVDSNERFNYGAEIRQAIKDKRTTYGPTIVAGSYDPLTGAPIAGYNITILPKVNNEGKVIGDDKPKTFYIPGMINETASEIMMQDPYVQAFNSITIIGGTRTTRMLTDNNTNPRLGTMSITGLGNNMYKVNFDGIEQTIKQKDAVDLTTAINDYNGCKNAFLSSGENDINPRMRSTIVHSAKIIADIYNVSADAVLDVLLEDINK